MAEQNKTEQISKSGEGLKQSDTSERSVVREKKKSLAGLLGTAVTAVMCAVLIPVLIFNTTLIVKSLINKNEVPDFAGIRPFIVMSGSMEDAIMAGDLILDRSVNTDDLKAGDIISFTDPAGNGVSVVTHRIVEVTEQSGEKAFLTKGDNNNIEDQELVPASKVLGIYWFRLAGMGKVCMFMQTTAGLLLCVLLPLLIFVFYDALHRRKQDRKKQADKEELMAELERLRAEMAAGGKAAADDTVSEGKAKAQSETGTETDTEEMNKDEKPMELKSISEDADKA